MLLKSPTPLDKAASTEAGIERPHLFGLLLSLIDSRFGHVHIMDTAGAAELEQYMRARLAARRAAWSQRAP